MNIINDPVLAAGEKWKQQIAAQAAGVQPPPIEDDPLSVLDGPKPGLIPAATAAINKGFHVFGLQPKDKKPLVGSSGFKDSKGPSDSNVLVPWNQDPNRNIGIDLGASGLCVLDFDKPESIPAWLNETKTYKVKSAKGLHVYFRGARKTTKLFVGGEVVGDAERIHTMLNRAKTSKQGLRKYGYKDFLTFN